MKNYKKVSKEGIELYTTNYEKQVKIALIERDRTMKWLADEVNRETGLKIDSSFLSKVLKGKVGSVTTVQAVEKLIGVAVPDGYGRGGFKA